MRALAQADRQRASALKARTLALWVAQNRLAAAQVASPWPALGSTAGEAVQAGARFVWQASVSDDAQPRVPQDRDHRRGAADARLRARAARRLPRQSGAAAMSARDRARAASRWSRSLLALAIFGVIAVLAYRATAALTDGEARLSAEAQRWRTLEALFTRFEADIRQAVPRARARRRRREPAWIAHRRPSGQSALAFTRAGSGVRRRARRRAGSASATGCATARVELVYWPQLDHADERRGRSSTRSSTASRRSSSST